MHGEPSVHKPSAASARHLCSCGGPGAFDRMASHQTGKAYDNPMVLGGQHNTRLQLEFDTGALHSERMQGSARRPQELHANF